MNKSGNFGKTNEKLRENEKLFLIAPPKTLALSLLKVLVFLGFSGLVFGAI